MTPELSFSGRCSAAWTRASQKNISHCLIAVVGIAAFIFLGLWTNDYLTAHNLYIALGAVLRFRAVAFVASNRDAKTRQSHAAVVGASFSRRHFVARAAADFQIGDRFVSGLAAGVVR